jgi:serine/threonine-protein kinase HipA
MDREVFVYVDLDGVPHLVGRVWTRLRKDGESKTFEYVPAWLEQAARFSLEPALALGPGPFHTAADTPMFGAIGDSAPDRWGRSLMRRMERRGSTFRACMNCALAEAKTGKAIKRLPTLRHRGQVHA